MVIWDNASWHKSKGGREWVKGHNHQVKQGGGVRLLTYLLPIKSPWLNPQEPHWAHCKRNVVEPKETLPVGQLKERIGSYFNSDTPLESLNLSRWICTRAGREKAKVLTVALHSFSVNCSGPPMLLNPAWKR